MGPSDKAFRLITGGNDEAIKVWEVSLPALSQSSVGLDTCAEEGGLFRKSSGCEMTDCLLRYDDICIISLHLYP